MLLLAYVLLIAAVAGVIIALVFALLEWLIPGVSDDYWGV